MNKKIFYNGIIITMNDEYVDAILVEDGIIKKAGTKEYVLKYEDEETLLIDLKGKTLMPSFIDSHSHFLAYANNSLELSVDGSRSVEDIQNKIKNYIKDNNIQPGVLIRVNGYDQNDLVEKRHILKEELDNVSKDNPLLISHKSGHMGVFNTYLLNMLEITPKTKQIEGGIIEIVDNNLTGYLEENAYFNYIKLLPMPTAEELKKAYIYAQEVYLSHGITTIQDGYITKEMVPLYKDLLEKNILKTDLIGYIELKNYEEIIINFSDYKNRFKNNFKIGGVKNFLDGSPQGRTAWMRENYIGSDSYKGYPILTDEELKRDFIKSKEIGMQLLTHANGDMAIEQYLNQIEGIELKRPVLIHSQFLGIDQMDKLKKNNIIPSFFVDHTYFWGDTHIENFGYERASKISPLRTTQEKGIIYTLHQDSPVIEPNMFNTVKNAVKRTTKNCIKLDMKESISVLDALKALTLNAAYQYSLENEKGSIEEGKEADLIILDKNPLTIVPNELIDISVLETIKKGKTLYKKR